MFGQGPEVHAIETKVVGVQSEEGEKTTLLSYVLLLVEAFWVQVDKNGSRSVGLTNYCNSGLTVFFSGFVLGT